MNRLSASLAKIFLFLFLGIGLSRVFFMTSLMGAYYEDLAKDNETSRETLEAARGVILDYEGKPLAMNIEKDGKTLRFYPLGEVVAPIVGYLGKMNKEELQRCTGDCDPVLVVGKTGLEKEYDERLKGQAGERLIRSTATGEKILEVSRIKPIDGTNINTNIDLELQKKLFVALKNALEKSGSSGAGVVAKVSGEVLALVSLPSFDPNLFVENGNRSDFGGDFKNVSDLITDNVKKPLYNRVVSGDFAPGSIYKIVTAMAGLEDDKITKDTIIVDSGEIKIGEYRFGNWLLDKYGRTEGELDVVKALGRSNDVFFYRVGEKVGIERLVYWSKKFGLGAKTGMDMPAETDGFMPTPYWREKYTGAKWFLGNTYHLSIGQGDIMMSPMQANRMTAAVVSGLRCPPRLMGVAGCEDERLSDSSKNTILEGMKVACSEGGTAYPLFDYGGKIYCKTGTAQRGGKDDLPHAWISVVVPRGDNVKNWLVITVLVEGGGEGSAVAAPVVKEIVPYILDK